MTVPSIGRVRALPAGLRGVCVAVTGSSPEHLVEKSGALLPEFPFQELRLDYLPDPAAALPALRSHVQTHPTATLLATCRRKASGGLFPGSEEAEFAILLEASRAGFALVDLALESAEALPSESVDQLRQAGAAVMLSWHDFERTGHLPAVLERMRRFRPDLYKIVPTANTLGDNLAMLRLLQPGDLEAFSATPIVGVSMGGAGVPSRVLGIRAGSAFTFAAASPDEATAPGQITARTLRDLYRIGDLRSTTHVFGVAGDPIRSSLSPLMLNTAFGCEDLDAVYLPLLTHDGEDLFSFARDLPLAGFSVTMPLKQAILPLLQHVDPLAARIGAVNTVRRELDGSFSGFNTDAAGVIAPLEQRVDLRGSRVLVLGAGGAARAAVFGCVDRGAQVFVLNRTPETGARLAAEAGATAIERHALRALPVFDALINATPAGMRGNATELPLRPEELHAKLVFDLVYNPLDTPLLRMAREQGLETIAGLEMFVHQGARQFELWMGRPAPINLMRDVVTEALGRIHS